ncbi:MAG: protein kinase domain-containing protein [Gemmataceae bacterium]
MSDPRLIQLLQKWKSLRDSGQSITPAEVCRDQPDLLEPFQELLQEQEHLATLASPPLYGNPPTPPLDPHATQPPNRQGLFDSTATTPSAAAAKPIFQDLTFGLRQYRILDKLGEGGMGEVYQAADPLFNRVLAIKVLKADHKNQKEYERRFLEEAQILGQLQHPGVPPVHDRGCLSDGRPFFAMKVVKGQTLERLLDRRPGLDHDLARFLDIFEQVCQTMANAHTHGVIHRDLKPSNIMVGAFGEVQVMDWGLAKVLAASEDGDHSNQPDNDKSVIATMRSETTGDFTQVGGVIGTPAFMPPEFALGQIEDHDERSDVFLLGGILCVILTGRPPYEAKKRLGSQQRADLQPAFDRLTACGADPELIDLAKSCLTPDQNARPLNAGVVADRLAAYRVAVGERTRRAELKQTELQVKALEERRRRRWQAALGALTTLTCLAGAGLWFQYRSEKETRATADAQAEADNERKARIAEKDAKEREAVLRKEAEEALKEVEKQRQRAEANFAKAQAAVDDYLTKISENQLLQVPGMQLLRRELLQSALTFYQGFLKERGDDPTIRAGLAAARLSVGKIQAELAPSADSYKSFQEALNLFQTLVKEKPEEPELKSRLAECYFRMGNYARAISHGEELVKAYPNQLRFQRDLAEAYNALASRGPVRVDQSLEAHRKALALRETIVQANLADPDAQCDLAQTLHNVAVRLSIGNQLEEAASLFRKAADHAAIAVEAVPHSVRFRRILAISYQSLGATEARRMRHREAVTWLQKTIDNFQQLSDENPAIPEFATSLWMACYWALPEVRHLGQPEVEALLTRQARSALERLPQRRPLDFYNIGCCRARCAGLLAERLKDLTPVDKAEMKQEANLAMEALKKSVALGYFDSRQFRTDHDLDFLRDREDYKLLEAQVEAKFKQANLTRNSANLALPDRLKANQEVLTLREKLAIADPGNRRLQADLAASKKAIALIYSTQGKLEEAFAILSQAKATCESLLKADPKMVGLPTELASIYAGLADLHAKWNHKVKAMELWQKSIEVLTAVNAANPADAEAKKSLIAAHDGLCTTYYQEGLWREAAFHLKKQVELDPENHWKAYSLAPLLVLNGEKDAYLEYRRMMLSRFAKNTVPEVAERFVRASLLLPIEQTELSRLSAMADMNLTDPKAWQYPFGLVAKAFTDVRQGNCKGALERIDLVLSRHPHWSIELPAHYLAALAHKGLKENLQAQEALDWADWQFNNLKLSAGEEKFDITIWIICQLLRREAHECIDGKPLPPDPSDTIHRARAYMRLGETAKAESEVEQATASAPTDPAVWLARGQIHQQLGKQNQAQASFTKAAELESKDPLPWIEQGRLLAERGDHPKADEAFARAAKLTPNELNRFFEAGWWVAGPYPQDLALPCPPEMDPDPSKPVAAAFGPKELTWMTASVRDLGLVELWRIIQGTPLSAYALNYVYSPDERTATLNVAADFGIRVWLNGRLVLDNPAMWPDHAEARSVVPIPVVLHPGRNTILAKITKTAAGHSFQIRLADNPLDRAETAIRFGLWEDAALSFAQYFRRQPIQHIFYWHNALACFLVTQNTKEMARWSKPFLQAHGNTTDPTLAFHVVSLCPFSASSPESTRFAETLEKFFPAGDKIDWQHYDAGSGLYRLGHFKEALNHLSRALELTPDWPIIWPILAVANHRTGKLKEAEKWLQKSEDWYDKATQTTLSRAGYDPPFQYQWWLLAHFQIYLREAQQLVRNVPNPEDKNRIALQARAREVISRFDPSTSAFDMAIQLDAYQPNLWLARARRHAELKHDKQAEADFAKAVELAPKDINVWKLRARAYAELGQFDNAAADYLKALALLPAALLFWDSQIQTLGQEIGACKEVFDRVIKERSKDIGLWMARRNYLVQRGQWQEAAKAANRLIELSPDDSVFWMGACMLHAHVGDLDSYRKLSGDMLAHFASSVHPENRERALKMAFLMPDTVQDFSALLKMADSLFVGSEKSGYLWYFNLARSATYYRAGKYDEAERLFKDVSTSAPGTYFKAEALLFQAMTKHKLGKKEDAHKNLEAARTLVTNDLPFPERGQPILGGDFHDRLRGPILLREAEALIEGKTGKADQEKKKE